MIFLELYSLPNATSGIDDIVIQTVSSVPALTPLILLFVFFVVFLGGIKSQSSRIGTADYPMWSVIASLSTLMIALLMSLKEGLIRLDWLIIVLVITIFSGVWLFLDKRQSEV